MSKADHHVYTARCNNREAALSNIHDDKGMSSIRVLTVSTVDITLAKLLQPIIRRLKEEGFVSEAACADGDHAERLRAEGYIVHGMPFRRSVLTTSHIRAFFALYRLLRKGNYDIIHVHTPFAQVIGRLAAKLAGVPIVLYTSHGFQFHESRSRWARTLIVWIERLLGRWTDIIFTQSQEDAVAAVRLKLASSERVVWIGNGISLEVFHPGPVDPTVREEFDLGEQDRVIVFVGRIVREKGVLELVEAMARVLSKIPSARLLVVGDTLASDGDVAAKDLFKRSIAAHGIASAVRFAGLRDDVPRILRAANLMVLPSWREGMPRSVIEGMASGLPIVATNIRGCREEVVHQETGLLVSPRNPEALAAAIVEILSDSIRAREMGLRGYSRALELFDEQKVISRQLAEYFRLVQGLKATIPIGNDH